LDRLQENVRKFLLMLVDTGKRRDRLRGSDLGKLSHDPRWRQEIGQDHRGGRRRPWRNMRVYQGSGFGFGRRFIGGIRSAHPTTKLRPHLFVEWLRKWGETLSRPLKAR
jgi:hypothetical protein